MPVEIELKLRVPPASIARWQRNPLLKSLIIAGPVSHKLHSVYYDTPDFDLRHAGVAFRLRREGKYWVQTVKGGGSVAAGLHQRQEFEARILKGQPDFTKISGTYLASLFHVSMLRDRLHPVFTTEFSRSTRILRLADGGEVEFCLDRGQIVAGSATMPVCEIELELKSGGSRLSLYRLALDLLHSVPGSVPLRLESLSKAERGYVLASGVKSPPGKAGPVPIAADMDVNDAFTAITWNCLDHLHNNEAGMLERGDIEYLHQMRVALRRARSALSIFSKVFSREAFTEIAQELKWLAGQLGPARDWDVFVTETVVPVCAAFSRHPGMLALREMCEKTRQKHGDEACRAVDSRHYTELMLKLGVWLSAESWLAPEDSASAGHRAGSGSGMSVMEFAGALLTHRHRQLKKRGKKLDSLDAPQLHALRIIAKKQRYAAEFFAGLYPRKEARQYIQSLSRLQDVLGVMNDVVVVEKLLSELSFEENQAGERDATGIIRGWSASLALTKKRELGGIWKDFDKIDRFW
ncbi:MAG: CYTH and CHAD domain-containing protein [Betaproteobacteria bacterium]|nr:CYTH and CHAD domain-containing protein [Betaproteobacteria bacterium]